LKASRLRACKSSDRIAGCSHHAALGGQQDQTLRAADLGDRRRHLGRDAFGHGLTKSAFGIDC
jgi:hypothetical protein